MIFSKHVKKKREKYRGRPATMQAKIHGKPKLARRPPKSTCRESPRPRSTRCGYGVFSKCAPQLSLEDPGPSAELREMLRIDCGNPGLQYQATSDSRRPRPKNSPRTKSPCECTESMQGIQKWSASQRRADYKPLRGVVGTQSMLSSEYVINDEYESFYTSLSKDGDGLQVAVE